MTPTPEQLMERYGKRRLAELVVALDAQLEQERSLRPAFEKLDRAVQAHLWGCEDRDLERARGEAVRLVRGDEYGRAA